MRFSSSILDIDHAYNAAQIISEFYHLIDFINIDKINQVEEMSVFINLIKVHISKCSEPTEIAIWQVVIDCLYILKSTIKCYKYARDDSGDIINERERLKMLCSDFQRHVVGLEWPYSLEELQVIICTDINNINIKQLLTALQTLPIPVTYFKKEKDRFPIPDSSDKKTSTDPVSLIRLIAFIDNTPLVSPQLLQPNLLYSLKFIIHGVIWHEDSKKLHLNLLSTCPVDDYSISTFILDKPKHVKNQKFEGEISGHLTFKSGQSLLSDNLLFTVRCAFELSNGSFCEVPVIGHHLLEFRINNPENLIFISHYKRLDLHVFKLIENLIKEYPSINNELPELIPVLEALTCLLGTYSQGAVFKQTTSITEREFQATILRDLRLKLGQDIEEHPSQAGGYTDIRYKGVIIELKVEKDSGDRAQISKKYSKQSTQYEGVEARQVSTVLVLDLTPKVNPPGDIRNDILLVDVSTHGGGDTEKEYPSKAFVFVVNGNIKDPSSYSS